MSIFGENDEKYRIDDIFSLKQITLLISNYTFFHIYMKLLQNHENLFLLQKGMVLNEGQKKSKGKNDSFSHKFANFLCCLPFNSVFLIKSKLLIHFLVKLIYGGF